MALPGRVGSGRRQAGETVGSPPAQRRIGGPPGLAVPVPEGAGHRPPVAGIARAVPGQGAGRIDGCARIPAVSPGVVPGLERHHERQPGLSKLAAEPVLIAVGAIGGHRAEGEPRLPRLDGQLRADRQPAWCGILDRSPPWRSAGAGCTAPHPPVIGPLISPQGGHADHPVIGLPYRASHCRPTCAVLVPSLRSPLSSWWCKNAAPGRACSSRP